MSSQQKTIAAVDVENIGGIDSTTVKFTPGVTILAGRNATNRTSFLQALMAALGSERASLKGNADQGTVTLELDGETYTRELTRTNGGVAFAGNPYLEDPQVADLFAFLLESNPARRAVVRDEDLRELILRPVDVDEIEARISQLQAEKRDIDNQLSELSAASRERDSLEEEYARVTNQLEAAEANLETARKSLQEAQGSDSESTEPEQLDALRETQSQLEDVSYDLETEQESVHSLEKEQAELEAKLDELSTVDEDELDELAGQIEQIRGRKRELDEIISQLQTVIQFNEQITEGVLRTSSVRRRRCKRKPTVERSRINYSRTNRTTSPVGRVARKSISSRLNQRSRVCRTFAKRRSNDVTSSTENSKNSKHNAKSTPTHETSVPTSNERLRRPRRSLLIEPTASPNSKPVVTSSLRRLRT
ncbi:archaea-specific SMC-related protein [Halalkalicoccus salilacus]|uniref:archaea-specific SMC-related protein n=1 Tax=Halalkalicoccus sp. GCM10025704 TaxID=3252662 RepID=UPI003615130F